MLGTYGTIKRPRLRAGAVYFLYYHSVPNSSSTRFFKQLSLMANVGRLISWTEALASLGADQLSPRPSFCLSFDDGDRTWGDVVLPILLRLRIPATFFVCASAVGPRADSQGLTWSDCRRLLGHGMNIGSHSLTHPRLAHLSYASAQREIEESKRLIEAKLEAEVMDFCAPYGTPYSDFCVDRDVGLAREAGYRSFACTLRGPMEYGDSPFFIRRYANRAEWSTRAVRGKLAMPAGRLM